jgi:hypothetical protein
MAYAEIVAHMLGTWVLPLSIVVIVTIKVKPRKR